MQNITGFGAIITLIASNTFPVGFVVNNFADDTDPFDAASIKIADTAMGVNGDLIAWAKAVPNPVVLNVIPGSATDVNLQILAKANKVSQGKQAAQDIITLTIVYPDGSVTTYSNGAITDAMFSKSISSQGRLKTRAYAFSFEAVNGS